jgi:hypothetical protein
LIKDYVEIFGRMMLLTWAWLFTFGVISAYCGGFDGVYINLNTRGEMLFEVVLMLLLVIIGTASFIYEVRRW